MSENNELEAKLANSQKSFSLVSCLNEKDEEIWFLGEIGTEDSFQIFPKSIGKLLAKIYIFDVKDHFKNFGWVFESLPKDLMIASFLENNLFSTEIDKVLNRTLNISFRAEKFEFGIFKEPEDMQNLYAYCHHLTKLLAKLAMYFENNLPPKVNELWTNIESPLALLLGKMEKSGVYIDQKTLQEISTELISRSQKLEIEIKAELDKPDLNLNSPSQLGPALVEFGIPLKVGSNGKISTEKQILEEMEISDETGIIRKVLTYRTLSKLNSTYAESFLNQLDEKSRIHTQFNQVQAPTGRLSSNSPNLQSIPIKHPEFGQLLRSCFASPDGRALVSADYSQMELRLLAHFSQDTRLIQAFADREDIHARTAAEIFEVSINDVTTAQRRLGKTLNFALVYQQGPFATAKQLGISQKEAKAFIAKYFARFEKVQPFVESTIQFARDNGFVETIYGRRRHFENLKSSNFQLRSFDERAAFNAVLQGSNADLIKDAMLRLEHRFVNEKINAEIVLQIHDELVLETDEGEAQKVLEVLKTEMELGQPLNVPILVEGGYGKNWSLSK